MVDTELFLITGVTRFVTSQVSHLSTGNQMCFTQIDVISGKSSFTRTVKELKNHFKRHLLLL